MESQSPAKDLDASLTEDEQHFNLMTNTQIGHSCMLHVFQYLNVYELLQAAQVCRMWEDIAAHPSLWKTVKMKDSMVVDWRKFAETLQKRGTQHLNLLEMDIPYNTEHMWDEFCNHIGLVTSLTILELSEFPSRVVDILGSRCPQLKVINAWAIENNTIKLSGLSKFKNLQELRLRSVSGTDVCTLAPLQYLTHLKHLSLTTFKNLALENFAVLGSLKDLKSLELGECYDMPQDFYSKILLRFQKLERLRLERCMGQASSTLDILYGVCKLPNLTQLELINVDVVPGFDKALAQCSNIRRLLIIPTYLSKAGATNFLVMNGVIQLHNTLTLFVWGITAQLITVTNFYDDMYMYGTSSKKSPPEDKILISQPAEGSLLDGFLEDTWKIEVPSGGTRAEKLSIYSCYKPPKEEPDEKGSTMYSVPLQKSKEFLSNKLPKTKVEILKVPYHATWWQKLREIKS